MTEQQAYTDSPWLDPEAEPFIKVRGITKKFGAFTAVNNVDLDIYRGELFCLLGGSGCGKSTLLRMLAGFEQPTSGSFSIDGVEMASVPAYERPTNMMFQSYALFPHMTVEKNVGYGLKQSGVPKSEIEDRVNDILKLVELQDFKKRKPHQLSGGQSQRVALARALVKEPKVLLLDEVNAGLNTAEIDGALTLIRKIADRGITILIIEHLMKVVLSISERILVLHHGELIAEGEPRAVLDDERVVEAYLGAKFAARIKKEGLHA